jgi:lysophospholipase L1-like esterase
MRKDWILLAGSVAVSLVVALALLRWLAPGLLGITTDLQLVQVDEKVPPFFESVIRTQDFKARSFLLNDPYTGVRAKPLLPETGGIGPHDLLGFRNRGIPNSADLVVIGDSQTYGNNAALEQNWPSRMAQQLGSDATGVYSMAVGGWAAVQYLDMFPKALVFRPRVILVAFYTGNDALESFRMAYGNELWKSLRTNPGLSQEDLPRVEYPPPKSDWWTAKFHDGSKVIFTPAFRLASNQDHPAVEAGYRIMADTAQVISELAADLPVQVVFTVIPTKEYAYAKRIASEGITPSPAYQALLEHETAHMQRLVSALRALPNARYVDVATALQQAVLLGQPCYLSGSDGHPSNVGYAVIGTSIAAGIRGLLKHKGADNDESAG